MNTEIIEKMKAMKFNGMLRAFRSSFESGAMNTMTSDEMIAHLIEEEWDDRYNRKIARMTLNAKFRYKASIEQMYFESDRGMDKNLVLRLAECTFIDKKENASKLFAKLKMAKADGSYVREIAKMERQQLVLIDDFGIQPLDAQSRSMFMEIIEDRHGKGSTIITSQVPVTKWHEVIGEQTIADAIVDRLIHNAHRMELKGESLRKRAQNKTENQLEINN